MYRYKNKQKYSERRWDEKTKIVHTTSTLILKITSCDQVRSDWLHLRVSSPDPSSRQLTISPCRISTSQQHAPVPARSADYYNIRWPSSALCRWSVQRCSSLSSLTTTLSSSSLSYCPFPGPTWRRCRPRRPRTPRQIPANRWSFGWQMLSFSGKLLSFGKLESLKLLNFWGNCLLSVIFSFLCWKCWKYQNLKYAILNK